MAEITLPEGWVKSSLSELNNYVGSSVDPLKHKETLFELYSVPNFFLDKPEYEFGKNIGSTKQAVDLGDVLISKINPRINRVWLVSRKSEFEKIASSEWIVFRQKLVDSNYAKRYFQSHFFRDLLCSDVSGVGGSLTRAQPKKVASYPFPLPPLAEQKVIADQLDSLLAQVERTKARLERIPTLMKQFRQSVLADAVSGKLTEGWRGITNYIELDLMLSKTSKSVIIPETWSTGALKNYCELISGNAFKSSDFLDSGDIPVIKISNIQYGEFESKNQQYLPSLFLEKYPAFQVKSGDILMALTRPITNDTLKVCRYPKEQNKGLLNQRVVKFLFKSENEKLFFEFLFQSSYFKYQVQDNLSETLQPNLSPTDLSSFKVVIPNPEEQAEIVRRVETLFAHADSIEQQAKAGLERVNQLTQSILAKAFRGELTAQWRKDHPELISGDNSAEALLERIKAERAEMGGKKKRGKAEV
jgi:type I restriction enzyme S subunit